MEAKPQETAAAAAQVARAGLVLGSLGVVTMQKEAEVAHAFDYAKAAGVSMIVAAPSAPMLGLIEKKAKEYDIRIAIHNHGPGDKHFPTPQSVYEHIQDLDPRIGLCIDIGHTVRVGADLIDSTRKYADRLYEIHMKDVTGTTPKAHEIQVGRGVIDIRAFLRALIDVKYAGVVSFEYEGEPSDPLPGVAESVGYVKGALEARGRKVS
jgi:sugar phosphate isomerase/epimerase